MTSDARQTKRTSNRLHFKQTHRLGSNIEELKFKELPVGYLPLYLLIEAMYKIH